MDALHDAFVEALIRYLIGYNDPDAGELPDVSVVMSEARCIVSVHLPHVPDTNQMAPEGPALIIGPSGILQTRVLTAKELALFAPDDRSG